MTSNRAWILLPSSRWLDLLNPDPGAWTDDDLAVGLSRTYRRAGYSAWTLPISVAQHSLTVLAIRVARAGPFLTPAEALRELLRDAAEALMGGWDPITHLKPHLGPGCFETLVQRLQATVDRRYRLERWSVAAHVLHKQANRLAAPCDAVHVAGWTREAIRRDLGITLDPLERDALLPPEGMRPWEPWPPRLACRLLLVRMAELRALTSNDQPAGGGSHNRHAV